MISNSLLLAIGNTPLLKLTKIVSSSSADVWIKYEGNNPTGSYKDRMALGVIRAAMDRGDLKIGDRLCEYTGGSTGTAIAFVASILGLKFTAVTSNSFAASKLQAIRTYGAELVLVESSDEKFLGKIFTPVDINELENTPFEVLPLTLTNRGDSFLLSLYDL